MSDPVLRDLIVLAVNKEGGEIRSGTLAGLRERLQKSGVKVSSNVRLKRELWHLGREGKLVVSRPPLAAPMRGMPDRSWRLSLPPGSLVG